MKMFINLVKLKVNLKNVLTYSLKLSFFFFLITRYHHFMGDKSKITWKLLSTHYGKMIK